MPANVRLPKPEEVKLKDIDISYETDRLIQNVTFFGDSAIPEGDPIYKSVWEAAKLLSQNGYTIVDGGGPGLMKAATDGAESVEGHTIAIYWEPKLASFFEGKNLANITDEKDAESNYVMRTFGLIEKGDAYVVCKGGTGTISEFGLVWCLAKLYYGCHKPVILYGEFWDDMIKNIQKNMYIDDTEMGVLYQATTPEEIVSILAEHEKKIAHCKLKEVRGDERAFVLGGREVEVTVKSYNDQASQYQSHYAGKLVAQEQLDEFMTMVNPPAKVLDIGCGPGFDTKYLSTKYSMTSLDISKRMVEIAKYENPGVDVRYCDITTYELEKNNYKGIWSRGAIHHIKDADLDKVFKNISDALVEGGVFYLIVREGEGEEIVKDGKDYGKVERFYHYFTEKELKSRGEKSGLKLVKVGHTKRSHKWIIGVFQK